MPVVPCYTLLRLLYPFSRSVHGSRRYGLNQPSVNVTSIYCFAFGKSVWRATLLCLAAYWSTLWHFCFWNEMLTWGPALSTPVFVLIGSLGLASPPLISVALFPTADLLLCLEDRGGRFLRNVGYDEQYSVLVTLMAVWSVVFQPEARWRNNQLKHKKPWFAASVQTGYWIRCP
jgi:hypothetical protein